MDLLRNYLEKPSSVVVLVGDNGAGKTRMLQDLLHGPINRPRGREPMPEWLSEILNRSKRDLLTAEVPRWFRAEHIKDLSKLKDAFEIVESVFPETIVAGKQVNFDNGWIDLPRGLSGLHAKLLAMAVFAVASSGGFLLIDDAETSVGCKKQNQFADYVFLLAREFGLKIILATHSLELCDALIGKGDVGTSYHRSEEDLNNLLYVVLARGNDGEARRLCFPGEKLRELVDVGGVDIRRANVS